MAGAQVPPVPASASVLRAQFHGAMRFAAGGTAALVVSEAMGWYPSFLAPVLAAVLLANLPGGLTFKAGIGLILIQWGGAYAAYILSSLTHQTPIILVGLIALILLLSFANLARSRALFLPLLLVLISFSTVPVVTMMAPQEGGVLPFAFTRGMVIAVTIVWVVHGLWPADASGAPTAAPVSALNPVALALTGAAIVLPMMIIYLMYGITDALPVLITTVVLVINFDPRLSATQASVMMIANFFGGIISLSAYLLLQIAPTLLVLTLITLPIAMFFGARVSRGGAIGAVALITYNQTMVLLSLALAPGGSGAGLWGTRLLQFAIASVFCVGLMSILWPVLDAALRRRAGLTGRESGFAAGPVTHSAS